MNSAAERIILLVREVTDQAVSPDHTTPLAELGVASLGWLRLLDALEAAFGVEIYLDAAEMRTITVDQLAAKLASGVRR